MTLEELEAKIKELESRISLLEADSKHMLKRIARNDKSLIGIHEATQ